MFKSEVFEKVISISKNLLLNFSEAEEYRTYIYSRLSDEIINKYNIGYFPPSIYMNLISNAISSKDLIDVGLAWKKQSGLFSYFENHGLVIPYYNANNTPIALIGRTLLGEEERKQKSLIKYKNTVFKKGNYCFNLNFAKEHILKEGFVYVVEGQLDAIKCYEFGIKNVVAVGSSSLSAYQFATLIRYTDNIIIVFDNDEAGLKGRKKIDEKYGDKAIITHLSVPMGYKDIDEYITKNHQFSLEITSY